MKHFSNPNALAMKIIFSIAFSLLTSVMYGQTKYFQISEGTIIDSEANEKRKAKLMQVALSTSIHKEAIISVVEIMKEIRRSKDSLIFSSELKLEIDVDTRKKSETKSVETKEYIGKEFPLKNLKTLNNKSISVMDLKGKPTLINFWFTKCEPCIAEMPVLNRIKSELKDSVNFVAITYESKEKVNLFLKKHKFNFMQVTNAQKFIDELGMSAFPVNIFLDKNGIVKRIENGIAYEINSKNMKMGDGKEFKAQLRALL